MKRGTNNANIELAWHLHIALKNSSDEIYFQ
jgi:hypothetical protein